MLRRGHDTRERKRDPSRGGRWSWPAVSAILACCYYLLRAACHCSLIHLKLIWTLSLKKGSWGVLSMSHEGLLS